jgi:hypothetical protein
MVDFTSLCLVSKKNVSVGNGVVIAVDVGGTGVALGRPGVRVAAICAGLDGTAVEEGAICIGLDGTGVEEGAICIGLDGTGVEAGAHPLNRTVSDTNARRTDPMFCFMTISPFDQSFSEAGQSDAYGQHGTGEHADPRIP